MTGTMDVEGMLFGADSVVVTAGESEVAVPWEVVFDLLSVTAMPRERDCCQVRLIGRRMFYVQPHRIAVDEGNAFTRFAFGPSDLSTLRRGAELALASVGGCNCVRGA